MSHTSMDIWSGGFRNKFTLTDIANVKLSEGCRKMKNDGQEKKKGFLFNNSRQPNITFT